MDLHQLQEIVNLFFDKAVIAISYTASSRLLDRFTSSSAHGLNIGIVTLGITLICFVLFSEWIKNNACLQTTLSIIISKLVIHLCMHIEPNNAHYDGNVLPATICFFLCFYSTLCVAIRSVLILEHIHRQWDQIVPFVIIFSTSSILKSIKQNAEMRFLYVAIFIFMIWRSTLEFYCNSINPYLTQFLDSIIARGILLMLDDFIYGTSTRPGLGLCFLFGCCLTIICTWFPKAKRSTQCQMCVGVLTYSFCSRVLQAIQKLCNEQISLTFVLVLTFVVLCLNLRTTVTDVNQFCAIMLGVLWRTILDQWLFSFYQEWEQLLMYMIIFWGIQGLKETITPILEKSSLLIIGSTPLPSNTRETGAVIIANEAESHAAKDHFK